MSALPAFASLDDLAVRVAVDDEDRAQAALDDASVEIRAVAGATFVANGVLDFTGYPSWAPDALVKVCCSAAMRSLMNPEAVSQESVGAYSVSYGNTSTDVYLTRAEQRLVRRAAGRTGLGVISTSRGDECATQYIDVIPPGEPMPWLADEVGY